eukprot:GILI01011960.1.p1 GENE.GILI01011960.1~~GILI01011960.1.p1  ORF type:complete len:420 (-),score=109.12 GILI01011960.1:1316-2575(-)
MADEDRKTTLCTLPVTSLERAVQLFGSFGPKGEIPLVLVPDRSCCGFWLSIPEGMFALVTSLGRYEGIWAAGYHFAPPWVKVQYLVTKQYIVFDTPVKDCPTLDNVQIRIDVTIVFRIMPDNQKVYDFAYGLGAQSLDQQLRAAQEEAVRGLARSVTHENAYSLRSVNTSEIVRTMNAQFNKLGVEIKDVMITNVHLPKDIAQRMQAKTTYESVNLLQVKSNAFQLQLLQDQTELESISEEKDHERQAEVEQAKKLQAQVSKEHQIIVAETNKLLAEIKQKELGDVMKIDAESEAIAVRLRGEGHVTMATIEANGRKEAAEVDARKEAYIRKKDAETSALVATNRAIALKTEATAEAAAAKMLVSKREFELNLARLKVVDSLSKNSNTVISGENNDGVLAVLAASQQAARLFGIQGPSK